MLRGLVLQREDIVSGQLPFVHFSTRNVPPRLQFEAWRGQLSAFDVSPFDEEWPKRFAADVKMYTMGPALVVRAKQGALRYEITPNRARTKGPNLYLFTYYERGRYRGYAGKGEIEGTAGDVQVLDLSQPMNSSEAPAVITGVVVSHEALREKLGTLDGLHGLDLRRTTGAFLGDYLKLLTKRLPGMSREEATAAAEATIGVIAACVRPTQERLMFAAEHVSDVLRSRAEKIIEDHIQDPRLSPEFLCMQLGVSRRTLYRAFQERAGVHEYILERRLDAVAHKMTTPGDTRTISELAELYGFSTLETFWRAFKRRYGLTPGEVRASCSFLSTASGLTPSTFSMFDQWSRSVRTPKFDHQIRQVGRP
ncbi:MAG: helix-turn-helix domain-containing protein [Mesorhizobium sp.]|nr:MAG: helix-turn-helix domain-containing protein [Mesorhizobium sp.]RWQ27092.1 MAG: helix-turn-helix domain-containing protein [Mesorhizobium sp.]